MPDYSELTQEVRFAVVLYGGVSLAIYINGVAQELLRLVRCTGTTDPLKGSEKVYAKLGALLRRGDVPVAEALDNKVRTRFRVDVISGTSAGGINGVFLAKALANQSELTAIQDLWFKQGAIQMLLNDKASYDDLKVRQPKDTESLLNSRRMYSKLLDAFDGMDPGSRTAESEEQTTSPLAEEIDLFATTTDIEGVPVRIQLFDNVVFERRYRNVFHFRYDKSEERNDFHADNNPFLAFAARCTSSFPFAFEPMRLCDIDEVMSSSNIYAAKSYCRSTTDRWQKFYSDYLQPAEVATVEFCKRSFGDGGYLDNAPFSYAVDTLLDRQPLVPVDRKLFYVEPSPEHPEEQPLQTQKPNAVENSLDALLVIPRYQTIRDDLRRVLDRNRIVTKVKKTLAQVESDLEKEVSAGRAPGISDCSKVSPEREITFLTDEICYRVYYRMRAASVTDDLALMVARMHKIDENSAYFSALRSLVRAWRESSYYVDSTKSHAPGQLTLFEFLGSFDLRYRLRRLRFVLRKLDDAAGYLLAPDSQEYKDAASTLRFAMGRDYSPKRTGSADEFNALRQELSRQHELLRGLVRTLLEKMDPQPSTGGKTAERAAVSLVRNALPSRDETMALLRNILGMDSAEKPEGTSEADASRHEERLLMSKPIVRNEDDPAELEMLCDRNAQRLMTGELVEDLNRVGKALAGMLRPVLQDAHEKVLSAASTEMARGMLRFYGCFDRFDSVQYPMMFGTNIGEADPVEIVRISPEDAPRLTPDAAERRIKLKGILVAHFGAFLEESWRESDLLWGRLDAAERIITALLPREESKTLRNSLIDEAQHEILLEFGVHARIGDAAMQQVANAGAGTLLTAANVAAIVAAAAPPLPAAPPNRDRSEALMRAYTTLVPPEMERSALLRTLARSTEIVGRMLETIADRTGIPPKAVILSNAGRAFWGLVEISIPRTPGELIGKYWLSLAALIEVVLIIGGTLVSAPGVAQLGWTLAGITFLIWMLRRVLWAFVKGPAWLRRLQAVILTVVILVLVALLGLGIWEAGQKFQQAEGWVKSVLHI